MFYLLLVFLLIIVITQPALTWGRSGVFFINFKLISQALVFLLLTLNM